MASLWLSGILYSAANLLLAVLLQRAGMLICLAAGVQSGFDLLPLVPPVLWLLLLVAPTAGLSWSKRRCGGSGQRPAAGCT